MNYDEHNRFIQEKLAEINSLTQKISNISSEISKLNKLLYQQRKQIKELQQQKKDIEKTLKFKKGDIVYFKDDPFKKKHIVEVYEDYLNLVGLSDDEYARDADDLVLQELGCDNKITQQA